ncbi:MAG: 2-oxo acid dehydrogenase subunit E2, partial [Bacteroidetes bacterium]|nr:2-oxo acid dehydrogenase subunit E2 [Bacteroidota bacterium]
MIIEFKLPELGENITSADIVKITVAPGDKVEVDQIVLEIETDKATVEVPSDKAGVVKEVLIKEGSTVKVSEVIFTMESDEAAKTSSEKSTVKTEVKTESPLKPAGAKIKDSKSSAAATDTWLYEFVLPELGENILTADITKILVKEGDSVEINQSVIEIETDKATVEVPSEVNGIVKDVKAREGEKANIGDVIFIFEVLGNADNKTMAKEPRKDVVKSETQVEYRADPVKAEPASAVEKIIPSLLKIGADVKIVPAAPTVRRFAREIGIDIHQVTGTGPGGRISIDDVKLFSKGFNERISKSGGGFAQYQQPLPDFSKWGNISTEPMNNVRKKTADHLTHAWSVIPHVTQFDKADITELEKLRKQFSAKVEMEGGKLTVTAILLKVVSSALKLYPQFNSSIDMDK